MKIIKKNIVEIFRNIPLWVYLLVFGLITFYTYDIQITADMGWHTNSALNIYLGKGYTFMDGSPIFRKAPLWPLMIALSYWLLGVSPWSAFWVVRIFAILNPIIIYFLGKKFYGKWIGFSAGLLVLSSYSLNYWSYRHLDAVWGFFVLLSILTIYLALEKRGYIYFILSAVFMGFAYLVKQAPVLLFPLPFLVWALVEDYRDKKSLKYAFIYPLLIGAMISPWIYYVYSYTENIKLALFGAGGEPAANAILNPNLFQVAKNYFLGLLAYYNGGSQSLSANFSIAPLFVLAWLFTFFRAIRRDRVSVILAICLFLLSPYISHVGRNNLRLGQLIIFLLLTYLVTANFLWTFGKYTLSKLSHFGKRSLTRLPQNLFGLLLIFGVIYIQVFVGFKGDKNCCAFFQRSFLYQRLFKNNNRLTVDLHYERNKKVAAWIRNNLSEGSKLMMSKPSEAKPIYFYSMADYPIFIMPVIQSNKLKNLSEGQPNNSKIFISSWTDKNDPRNKIYVLTENDLLASIDKNQVDYIIIGEIRNYLSLYLNINKGFKKIKEFEQGKIKIYKILKLQKIGNFRTMVSERVVTYLNELNAKDRHKFNWYKDKFFGEIFGWDQASFDDLVSLKKDGVSKQFILVRNWHVY